MLPVVLLLGAMLAVLAAVLAAPRVRRAGHLHLLRAAAAAILAAAYALTLLAP